MIYCVIGSKEAFLREPNAQPKDLMCKCLITVALGAYKAVDHMAGRQSQEGFSPRGIMITASLEKRLSASLSIVS